MKDWIVRADNWINKHRPWTLLATVAATFAILAAFDWHAIERLLYPQVCNPRMPSKCDPIEWKERFQATILMLSIPVAFWLWHWRDRNVRDQIENTRKDLNLREFNDVQTRLAAAIDEGISERARIALQTNALFQMSAFLSGDRAHGFSRAAFEAVRAKFSGDFQEIFRSKFKRDAQEFEEIYDRIINSRHPKYRQILKLSGRFRRDLREIRTRYQNDPSKNMNRRFFLENFEDIFANNENARHFDISTLSIPSIRSGVNLKGIQAIGSTFLGNDIDGVDLSSSNLVGSSFREISISKSDFRNSSMDLMQIVNSNFSDCDFSHAKLRRVQLLDLDPHSHEWRNSKFIRCNFAGADLTWTQLGEQNLANCDFSNAILICTNFDRCEVVGSDFTNCDMRGATMTRIDPRELKSCVGARFDDATLFHLPAPGTSLSWTQEQLQEIRNLWRSCGARHINDL